MNSRHEHLISCILWCNVRILKGSLNDGLTLAVNLWSELLFKQARIEVDAQQEEDAKMSPSELVNPLIRSHGYMS